MQKNAAQSALQQIHNMHKDAPTNRSPFVDVPVFICRFVDLS